MQRWSSYWARTLNVLLAHSNGKGETHNQWWMDPVWFCGTITTSYNNGYNYIRNKKSQIKSFVGNILKSERVQKRAKFDRQGGIVNRECCSSRSSYGSFWVKSTNLLFCLGWRSQGLICQKWARLKSGWSHLIGRQANSSIKDHSQSIPINNR